MKSFLKIQMSMVIVLMLSGCSTHDVSDAVDNALVATSGNKPPQFFAFASPYRANGYIMDHKDFSFMMPATKEKDWNKMSGWGGAYIYGGVGIGVDNPDVKTVGSILGYGIDFSSSLSDYGDMEMAIESKNYDFIKTKMKSHGINKYGRVGNLNVHYEVHGKEQYPCLVKEAKDTTRGVLKKVYFCYKFNPAKTRAKSVTIKLIYTKAPNLPKKYKSLASQYTYKDLQKRAKRTLDSLYIKEGW